MIRNRKHRLDPYKEEIKEHLAQGETYCSICDFIFEKHGLFIDEPVLCLYVNSRGLKTQITRGYHQDKAPHCKDCENYIEVSTNHIRDRKTNVRVCKACLEVIPNTAVTSPVWCPKRKE